MKTLLPLAMFLFAAMPAAAADAVTECDRLAAHSDDPDRIAPGLHPGPDALPAAVAACEKDVAADPDNLRLRYQLARVLFYSGDTARGVPMMREVADAGYRQAQFVYGAFISNKRPDAPADICLTEQYWLKSARAGRQAARVSYVRHAVKGLFDGCAIQAGKAEMESLMDIATQEASNYYERLLIADVKEALAKYGE